MVEPANTSSPSALSSEIEPVPNSATAAAAVAIAPQYSHPCPGRKTKYPTFQWTVMMATAINPTRADAATGVANPAANETPAAISVAAAIRAFNIGDRIPIEPNHPAVPAMPRGPRTLLIPCQAIDNPKHRRRRNTAMSGRLMLSSLHAASRAVDDDLWTDADGHGWQNEEVSTAPVTSRFARARALIGALVSRQKLSFAVAVSGAAVFALCTAGSSLGVRWVIDRVIVPRFRDGEVAGATVATGCVILVVISLVRATGVVVRRTFAGKTEWGVAEKVGNEVAERYAAQPASWHRTRSSGDLVARAGVDVEASVAVLAPLPYGSSVLLLLLVSAVGLLLTDVVVGIAASVVLPVLLGANIVYQRAVDKHFNAAQHEMGRLSEAVLESFEGVTVVKAFGAETRETERLSAITARLRDARVRAIRARATFEMMLDAVPSLANLTMLWLGAWRVGGGYMTVGELVSVMYLFTLLVLPMRLIGYVFSEIPHSLAGWARVREVSDEPLSEDPTASIDVAPHGEAVVVEGLRVSQDGQLVLPRIDLVVRSGTRVAVVGPTGSGKSTLLAAIAGLVAVDEGRIAVARGGTSIVFQEAFVFSGSVRFNICLGNEIADDVVAEAIRVADAGFLLGLEQGLDTELGERGVSLSGGQRQRLALARALVRRAPVLLLDDTTSALDPATEMRVLKNLGSTGLVETVIAVAARPSTIATADVVVHLGGDGLAHVGSHDELLSSNREYRDLIAAFDDDRRATATASASGAAP